MPQQYQYFDSLCSDHIGSQ